MQLVMIRAWKETMVGCDSRLLGLSLLLPIGFYVATHRNYFRLGLIDFRSDVHRKRAGNETKLPCSFAEFREYLLETGLSYLPGDGRWKRRRGQLDRFHPDLCSLSYGIRVPRDRLARCFTRLNVSYVAILGDSNALRLYKVVRRTLSAFGSLSSFSCDGACRSDVIKPSLPARHCSPYYLPLHRFLPPNYFRCKIRGVIQGPAAPLLVQYLPVTGDFVPLHTILNRSATGCVDPIAGRFAQTPATTVQASIRITLEGTR